VRRKNGKIHSGLKGIFNPEYFLINNLNQLIIMSGLIGKKIGMTSIFDENGKNIPCTVIQAGPCVVTQVRTTEVDGYEALQLGFDDKSDKAATKAAQGHFKKAGTVAKRKVVEFQGFKSEHKLGDEVTVEHFAEGEFVDVAGTSKGKGFQGVVKRHGFGGVGPNIRPPPLKIPDLILPALAVPVPFCFLIFLVLPVISALSLALCVPCL